MNIIRPEVDVEGLLRGPGLPDEGDRLIDKPAGDLRPEHPPVAGAEALGVSPDPAGLLLSRLEHQRQQLRPHPLEIGQGCVEAIGRDRRRVSDVSLPAHMPLAEMPGGVAGLLKGARQHRRLRIKPLGHAALVVVVPVAQKGGDLPALGILAGRDRRARRRTDRRVHVELLKANALGRHPVDIGGAGILVAEAGKISPAHIVDEKENDVGAFLREDGRPRGQEKQTGRQEKTKRQDSHRI